MAGFDPTVRFTGRAAVYHAARPTYPDSVLAFLAKHAGLGPGRRVVDLGCGTGIFSRLLLQSGADVTGVEPNADMRAHAASWLAKNPSFSLVEAPAEETGLPEASLDLGTAAQAYHWFDEPRVAEELRRILRPPYLFFAVWNERDHGSPFFIEYDGIVRRYRDAVGQSMRDQQSYPSILDPTTIVEFRGEVEQTLDLEGLIGRAESNSGFEIGSAAARSELTTLFERYAKNHRVKLPYTTTGWLGQVQEPA